MAPDAILAPGFAAHPYWWETAPPRLRAPEVEGRADVVVISGGIAGLSAAILLSRNGARPLVLDREAIGWDASSRNEGPLVGAPALRRAKTVNPALLAEMEAEAEAAFEELELFVGREGLQCGYRRSGRFVAAVPDLARLHRPALVHAGRHRGLQAARSAAGMAMTIPPRLVVRSCRPLSTVSYQEIDHEHQHA